MVFKCVSIYESQFIQPTWYLIDLFGIEDNDSHEDDDTLGNYKEVENDTSFKPFRLLNALSDLMMLPFEMLADAPTRKEVSPSNSSTS